MHIIKKKQYMQTFDSKWKIKEKYITNNELQT